MRLWLVVCCVAVLLGWYGLTSDVGPLSLFSCTVTSWYQSLTRSGMHRLRSDDPAGIARARLALELKSKLGVMLFSWTNLAHIEAFDGVVDGRVPIRCYLSPTAKSQDRRRAIVMLHGGGFVLGSLESHDYIARRMAHETDALVVSVDYRLAPEHPFPAGQQDVVTVLDTLALHAQHNSERTGHGKKNSEWTTSALLKSVAPEAIIVMGDSAGGNLAATSLLRAHLESRHRVQQHVVGQLLVYPTTHAACHECHRSFARYGDGYYLTASAIAAFGHLYLGSMREQSVRNSSSSGAGSAVDERSLDVQHSAHPLVSPLDASLPLLGALPPTAVAVAECDPLVDEAVAFVQRLRAAAVAVEAEVFPRTVHGFVSVPLDEHEAAVAFLSHAAQRMWDKRVGERGTQERQAR